MLSSNADEAAETRLQKDKKTTRHDAVVRPRHGEGVDLVARDDNTDFDNSSAQQAINLFSKKRQGRGEDDETSDDRSRDASSLDSESKLPQGTKPKRGVENGRGSSGPKRGKAKDLAAARENAPASKGEDKEGTGPSGDQALEDEPASSDESPGILAPHGAGSRNEEDRQNRLAPESSGTMSSNLYTFKLPQIDPTIYIQFLDQLLFGTNRKAAIM